MKYTELTIVKTGKNEFNLSICVYQTRSGGVLSTLAKDDFYMSYEEVKTYLFSLAFVDPNVRAAARSGVFQHRCRTAEYGDLCLSLRWDGSYLDTIAENNREFRRVGPENWVISWPKGQEEPTIEAVYDANPFVDAIEQSGGFVLDDTSYISADGEIHLVPGGGLARKARGESGSNGEFQ